MNPQITTGPWLQDAIARELIEINRIAAKLSPDEDLRLFGPEDDRLHNFIDELAGAVNVLQAHLRIFRQLEVMR